MAEVHGRGKQIDDKIENAENDKKALYKEAMQAPDEYDDIPWDDGDDAWEEAGKRKIDTRKHGFIGYHYRKGGPTPHNSDSDKQRSETMSESGPVPIEAYQKQYPDPDKTDYGVMDCMGQLPSDPSEYPEEWCSHIKEYMWCAGGRCYVLQSRGDGPRLHDNQDRSWLWAGKHKGNPIYFTNDANNWLLCVEGLVPDV